MKSKGHIGDCSKCASKGVLIDYMWSNPKFRLCKPCNMDRIRNRNALKARNKARKSYHIAKPRKRLKSSASHIGNQTRDALLNKEIWKDRKHQCFECEIPIHGEPVKTYFSHVHGKGARPDLRHVKMNVVLHCPPCHRKWETSGARETMPKTLKLFERIAVEHQDNKFDRK